MQDAERLLAAAEISIPALEAEVERLNQEGGTKEESLENAESEAMRHWLKRGSTSQTRGVSKKLKMRMRPVKKGDDQDVLFEAAKMMVGEHLKMEQFARDDSAKWLSELDLSDYASRPRGLAKSWEFLLSECCRSVHGQLSEFAKGSVRNSGGGSAAQAHRRANARVAGREVGLHSAVRSSESDLSH